MFRAKISYSEYDFPVSLTVVQIMKQRGRFAYISELVQAIQQSAVVTRGDYYCVLLQFTGPIQAYLIFF
jgi:hypothetical protein